MTTAREASLRFDAPTRRRMGITTVAALLLGTAAVMAYWWGYERLVQHPACYAYAQARGMGDARSLRVTSVDISRGYAGEHRCSFRDRRTGEPVFLRFAPGDIPRVRDFLEWTSMAAVLVLVMALVARRGVGHVVDPRYHRSAQDALRRRAQRRGP